MYGQAVVLTTAAIAITLACLLGVVWLGPAAALFNVMTAVPAAYLSVRLGMRYGLFVVAITALLLLVLTSAYVVTTYLALFGLGSLLLPFFLLLRVSWDRAALYSVVGALIFSSLLMLLVSVTGSLTPTGVVEQIVQAEAVQALEIYRQAGFSEQQLQEIGLVVDRMAAFVVSGFPGILGAVLLTIQLTTLLILHALTRKHYQIPGVTFAAWRLPAKLIWLLIASGSIAFLGVPVVSWITQNLLLVLLPLYFLQGMAVVNSFLQQRPWPLAIKGLIYLALLIFSPLPLIVTSIGVFDLWIDFRKIRQEKLS